MKTKFLILALCVTLYFCAAPAFASLVTIEISGHVTSASGSALPATIYENVPFTGTYAYDTLMSDSDSDPQRGVYEHSSPYGTSIALGGCEFKTTSDHVDQFEIQIKNDVSLNGVWDSYTVFSDENISIPYLDSTIGYISWVLADSTHTVLSSDALPLTAPVLTDWSYNQIEIYGFGNSGLWIRGTVTQVALIPEPFAGILMAVGCLWIKCKR